MDWPVTLEVLTPYCARAENQMGVTRTNNIPVLTSLRPEHMVWASPKWPSTRAAPPMR